jgi:sigma-B regulation protein RsbU (phosphoserine phosphatase)
MSGGLELEIVGTENPAGKVSGDLFDIVETGGNSACLAMGDACGHGVAAGMLVVDVRRLLAMMATSGRTPGQMLTDVNRNVMRRFPTCRFVTLTLLAIDGENHAIRYATAGQPFYRVHADGRVVSCDSDNSPIGIFEDEQFQTIDVGALQGGELLVLISDGFREALNADRKMYGEERLLERMTALRECDSEQIIEGLFADVEEFQAGNTDHDDMTVVIARLKRV